MRAPAAMSLVSLRSSLLIGALVRRPHSASSSSTRRAVHTNSARRSTGVQESTDNAAADRPAVPTPATPATRPTPPMPTVNLLGLTLPALTAALADSPMRLPAFRARQIAHWIYERGERDFARMTDLSARTRADLARHFCVDYGTVVSSALSQDGTRKFLVALESVKSRMLQVPGGPPIAKDRIECVYIPMSNERGGVCVSSQVGCSLTCAFCATGAMDKSRLRNLTAAEIIGQVMVTKHAIGDYDFAQNAPSTSDAAAPSSRGPPRVSSLRNVIFMGMGEPGYNYRGVRSAIDILTSHPRAGLGLPLGRPRVTVSTSGVTPAIDRLLEDFGGNVSLAISLHAVNDQLRDELVPINKQFPLNELMEAVRRYQDGRVATGAEDADQMQSIPADDFTGGIIGGRRRVTFEYVMLRGVNDSLGDARQLLRLIHGVDSLVNLIPFNPWPESTFETSHPDQIDAFAKIIRSQGVACTIRGTRGQDIDGACGQLALRHEKTRASTGAK